ncbi:type II toxin-antitoxin system PemK/MazF family toxin [Geomesophilobacter sediminis]|uniref:Type II toxin-antitoxin system PemK/MazF family toxin n=1 Tax=Geomesophilobacter sediminis TaxID=2798584 RepID=A0A8J7M305_9BACT|nr:type II toxin-antitoxin system PemK/MazF family toxin [Geomesophilobacter sediminis]MBJ6727516.1 type II toxin-antitoxin system PemK/MazF family toxin [Geomesophilobacter sediminis]
MKRGDLVLVAVSGDYGKPRPALVIQTDFFGSHPSITVCLVTSHLLDAPLYRLRIEPTVKNGLQVSSEIQIDKIMTVPREKVRTVMGELSDKDMGAVTKLLALWVGIAG